MRGWQRVGAGVGVALCAAFAALATGPAAQAGPAVKIYLAYYDSPGVDMPVTNAKLNGEFIQLKNMTSRPVSLKGWKLRDKQGNPFTFPTFTLGAGKTVKIHTGRGTNTSTDRYWGRSGTSSYTYIWSNTSDAAFLRNASGGLVHSCGWTSRGRGYKYC